MVQFRPAAVRGQFDPPVVEDFSQAMSADMQRRLALQQNANQQTAQALQQEVQNAKYTTQNDAALQTLAQFSKTAADYVQKNAEQTAKDIQDGQDWDYLFGADNPATNLAEEVATEAADMQAAEVADTTAKLDQVSPILGNTYYKNNIGIAKGLRNERALAIWARNNYAPYLMGFRDSEEVITIPGLGSKTAREWYESTDAAAISAVNEFARYRFIKKYGLQYLTKRTAVKYLRDSFLSAEGNSANNILNTNIQNARTAEVERIQGLAGAEARQNSTFNRGRYEELVQLASDGSTGLNRSNANKKIAEAFINGYEIDQDLDALNRMASEFMRYDENGVGIPGTRFGDHPTIGPAISNARFRIERGIQRADDNNDKQLIKDARVAAQNAGSYEDALDAVTDIASGIQDEKKRQDLIDKVKELRVTDNERARGNYLLDLAEDGYVLKREIYDQMEANGELLPDTYKKLIKLTEDKDLPSAATRMITDEVNLYNGRLAQNAGLKYDTSRDKPFFDTSRSNKSPSIIDISGAKEIGLELKRDMQEVASNAYNAQPRNMPEEEKLKEVKKALDAFKAKEITGAGGYYNFDDLRYIDFSRRRRRNGTYMFKPGTTPAQQGEARTALNRLRNTDAAFLAQQAKLQQQIDSSEKPVEWYLEWTPGSAVTPRQRMHYSIRRGDQFFTEDQMIEYQQEWVKTGRVPQDIEQFALDMNKSPMAVFNSHLASYGLSNAVIYPTNLTGQTDTKPADVQKGDWVGGDEPVDAPKYNGQGGAYEISQGQGGSGQLTPYQGAQWFMRADFPPRGAAFLAGNINAESSWIAGKEPHDDVGRDAGGLVSWRAQRLAQIQEELGAPIQYLTTEQQLQYMLKEMQKPQYKEAYDIFMDPKSTRRDLIYASKIYWGYGVEGSRYRDADAIIKQMKAEGLL